MSTLIKYYNALTFDAGIMNRAGSAACARINYVGTDSIPGVVTFFPVEIAGKSEKNIYVGDLFDEDAIDKATELVYGGAKLMLCCCRTLSEVGTCDKRYGVTPIGLAHKLGLLGGALVAGANYLDKDDIDMLIQSGAEVILTPSTAMGNGFGIPPLRMLLSLGATVHLGTGEYAYNKSADIEFEARLIALAACGALCTKDAVTFEQVKKLCEQVNSL